MECFSLASETGDSRDVNTESMMISRTTFFIYNEGLFISDHLYNCAYRNKASILQCSAFFTVQLSHPYMTTGKTIALTRWTFVGKVISLLFNMLSRFVITFLSRSKHLLIPWLQSPSAVILEAPKIKSNTVSTVSPLIPHGIMVPDAMILVF